MIRLCFTISDAISFNEQTFNFCCGLFLLYDKNIILSKKFYFDPKAVDL